MIGLTGPIASGKSTIAHMLEQRGAEVIDADAIYASLITPGSELLAAISRRFGPEVITADGRLDRAALGEIVFSDGKALADLDTMTHPAVVAEVRRRIARSTAPVIAIEAIKLVSAGLTNDLDSLWYVTADPHIRLNRLMARGGIAPDEARARLEAASDPLPEGVTPDVTIDNSGDLAATSRAVAEAWHELMHEAGGMSPGGRQEEVSG